MFRLLREANVRMLKRLTSEEWERSGIHAERGKITVRDLAQAHGGSRHQPHRAKPLHPEHPLKLLAPISRRSRSRSCARSLRSRYSPGDTCMVCCDHPSDSGDTFTSKRIVQADALQTLSYSRTAGWPIR